MTTDLGEVPSPGLKHTDSVSGCSLKSHDSVRAVGAHPLGTPRVCNDAAPSSSILFPSSEPGLALAPSSSSMLVYGDAIVLLDIPKGFIVGYDTVSFTNREGRFRGVKEVPPGPHIVWVTGSDTAGVRYGYWIWVDKTLPTHMGMVHVKQWDTYNEILGDPASHAEDIFQQDLSDRDNDWIPYSHDGNTAVRASSSVENVGGNTAAGYGARTATVYTPAFVSDFSPAAAWSEIVYDITPTLLSRVVGKGEREWPVSTLDTVRGEFELSQERKLYSSISAPQLSFLLSQDTKTFDKDVTGRERTEQALDSTSHILSVLAPAPSSKSKSKVGLLPQPDGGGQGHTDADIVGEFQFVFLTGLLLGNASCSDQWWYIVSDLLFRAYALPIVRPGLARCLIRTFLAQLVYLHHCVEQGNLWDTPTNPQYSQSRLQKVLATYRKRLDEQMTELITEGVTSPQQTDAKMAFDQLECWLEERGWDLSGQYVREGMVTLEDGEEVRLRLKDDDADAEADEGEFAPVIVEMDDHGKEVGMVRWD
ncbi:hypothetical protein MKZ38_007199 [Zalerion maritima]|uniref:AAR2 protein n=1 Tax=Zalerion maritima TaxID=339359 RepID=A0AAD5RJ97_9PEZI|nr:hypothetical protein MKZ38_007199 [Zalerion maritima]